MHYVYILQSKQGNSLYTGCTSNVKKRFALHNAGKVRATKTQMPLKLIHYEALINKYDAFAREKWLKTGWGRNHLRKALKHYLKI